MALAEGASPVQRWQAELWPRYWVRSALAERNRPTQLVLRGVCKIGHLSRDPHTASDSFEQGPSRLLVFADAESSPFPRLFFSSMLRRGVRGLSEPPFSVGRALDVPRCLASRNLHSLRLLTRQACACGHCYGRVFLRQHALLQAALTGEHIHLQTPRRCHSLELAGPAGPAGPIGTQESGRVKPLWAGHHEPGDHLVSR